LRIAFLSLTDKEVRAYYFKIGWFNKQQTKARNDPIRSFLAFVKNYLLFIKE